MWHFFRFVVIISSKYTILYCCVIFSETYHYVPTKGVGVHKDGTKVHMFDYEVSLHNRSKDFFGEDIDQAMNDINALADVIVCAFGDLVLNGNDDMTSFLYLKKKAIDALSQEVKDELEENGISPADGGVALGLVTELVATAPNAEALIKKAVLPRGDISTLTGIEAMNEANIQKVYTAITPMVQTKGILLNNGIDLTNGWATALIEEAPTLDKIMSMDFDTFRSTLNETDNDYEDLKDALKAPTGDELIAHKMYAGLLGSPTNVTVPSIRGYLLEQGINPDVANQMEKVRHKLSYNSFFLQFLTVLQNN
jgi:hypothetical protein